MDNWENKIIADKLNGLQQLPEGYMPNLDSKWEIIEAGLPKQKRKIVTLFKWVAAAAIITMFFYNIKFLLPTTNQTALKLFVQNISTTNVIAVFHQPKIKTTIIVKNGIVKNKKNIFIEKNKMQLANKGNRKLIIDTIMPVLTNISINKPTHLPPINSMPQILLTKTEAIKATKTKKFQKDFVDDVLTMDKQYKPGNEHAGLKVLLNKSEIRDNEQSTPSLQWKKSF